MNRQVKIVLGGILASALASALGCSPEPPKGPVPTPSGRATTSEPKLVIKEGKYAWKYATEKSFFSRKAGGQNAMIHPPAWEGAFVINPDGTVKGSAVSDQNYRNVISCNQADELDSTPNRTLYARSTLALKGRVRGLKLELELKRTGYKKRWDILGAPSTPCPHGMTGYGSAIYGLMNSAFSNPKPIDVVVKPDRESLSVLPGSDEGWASESGFDGALYNFSMTPASN